MALAFALLGLSISAGCRPRGGARLIPDAGGGAGPAVPDVDKPAGEGGLVPGAAPMPMPLVTMPGHVRVTIDGEPQSLNPDLDPDVWTFRIAWDAIYEPLIRPRDAEASGGTRAFEPVLAERYSVEDEGKKILFHLRPGVYFHDGKPLTAFDVAFTFDRIRSAKTHAPRLQGSLADLESVDVVSRDLVRMNVRKPSAYLLSAIADIGILPEHVFAKGDFNYHPASRHPVGSGPFKFGEWDRGKRITLVRNDAYWGEKASADAIDIDLGVDAVKGLGRAKRGETDLLARVPPSYVPEQLDSPSLRARFDTLRVETPRFVYVAWNTAHPPLDDASVRRAISIALDRKRLLEDARHSIGRVIGGVPMDVTPPPARSDLAQAQAVLDQAGLLRGPGGYRLRGPGRPVRLQLLVPTGTHEAEIAARRVADVLGKLGLPTDIVSGDLSVILLRLRNGTFDGALLEWSARDTDDLGPLFRRAGAYDFGAFDSRELDLVLEALRRPEQADGPRAEVRDRLREKAAALVSNLQPALFLYSPDGVYLYGKRLRTARRVDGFPLLRDIGPR